MAPTEYRFYFYTKTINKKNSTISAFYRTHFLHFLFVFNTACSIPFLKQLFTIIVMATIPAAQSPEDMVFPGPAQYFPGGHGSHCAASISPTLSLNVPGGH